MLVSTHPWHPRWWYLRQNVTKPMRRRKETLFPFVHFDIPAAFLAANLAGNLYFRYVQLMAIWKWFDLVLLKFVIFKWWNTSTWMSQKVVCWLKQKKQCGINLWTEVYRPFSNLIYNACFLIMFYQWFRILKLCILRASVPALWTSHSAWYHACPIHTRASLTIQEIKCKYYQMFNA